MTSIKVEIHGTAIGVKSAEEATASFRVNRETTLTRTSSGNSPIRSSKIKLVLYRRKKRAFRSSFSPEVLDDFEEIEIWVLQSERPQNVCRLFIFLFYLVLEVIKK